jgi:hypothetical protein
VSEFVSLEAALEGQFDKTLTDLPEHVREHAGMCAPSEGQLDHRAFTVWHWDSLSPDRRRQVAHQWDCLNDPAHDQEGQRAWASLVKCDDLEREIVEWGKLPGNIPTERLAKDARLAALRLELDIEKQNFQNSSDGIQKQAAVSVRGERACQQELENLMRANQNAPDTKANYRSRLSNHHSISIRGFDRAWANAITATGNTAWSKAGAKPGVQKT